MSERIDEYDPTAAIRERLKVPTTLLQTVRNDCAALLVEVDRLRARITFLDDHWGTVTDDIEERLTARADAAEARAAGAEAHLVHAQKQIESERASAEARAERYAGVVEAARELRRVVSGVVKQLAQDADSNEGIGAGSPGFEFQSCPHTTPDLPCLLCAADRPKVEPLNLRAGGAERLELSQRVQDLAAESLRVIAANREHYLACWFAETGLKPSESMLVEERKTEGTTITTTVRVVRREEETT